MGERSASGFDDEVPDVFGDFGDAPIFVITAY